MITVPYFHNHLWSSSASPAAFTVNLTNRNQTPCAPLTSLTTSGAGDKEVLKWHRCEYCTEENERSKTLKNESLSPLTASQLGKWCEKYKRTSWAHLRPAPTILRVVISAIIIATFVGILYSHSCSMFLVSSSWEGQDKSVWLKTATFHHQMLEFSHRLWTSL